MNGVPVPQIDRVAAELSRLFGPRVVPNGPLGALTTYRVGGPAALFVEVESEEDLLAVRSVLRRTPLPVLVVGNGSNLLVADRGFDGVALHLGKGLAELSYRREGSGGAERGAEVERSGGTVVRAGAALALPVLARQSVEAGFTGLEWAVGVPGTVGGAVRMNAGGHGADMAGCLRRFRWVRLAGEDGAGEDGAGEAGTGEHGAGGERPGVAEAGVERLAYGYRNSSLGPTDVVVWAELAVAPGDPAAGRSAISSIVGWRRANQPGGSNAGSVFANPPGDAAGRLVESVGLKGFRLGTAQVSSKHANFIQADDGGSADDVAMLMDHVRAVVAERTGVVLRPEVHRVGFLSDETQGMEQA